VEQRILADLKESLFPRLLGSPLHNAQFLLRPQRPLTIEPQLAERPGVGPAPRGTFLQRVRRCNDTRSLHMVLSTATTAPRTVLESWFSLDLCGVRRPRAVKDSSP